MESTLPTVWRMVKLGDITEIVGGATPSRAIPSNFGGDIPWVTPTDVTALNDLWIEETTENITERGLRDSSTRLLPEGTVLMTSRATIGVTAINQRPLCTNQGFANFICDPQLLYNLYLAYWLPYIKKKLEQLSGITTFLEISKATLAKVQIPLPPLSEQQRIVAMLRKADELRRWRREVGREAQSLFPALFDEMFGSPIQWRKPLMLGECVTFVGGGTPSRKVAEYFSGDIPWATSKDIKSRYLDDAEEHISEEAIVDSATNLVPSGSILIVVKSKILAHTLPVSITTRSFCFGQDIKGLVCHEGYDPRFIAAAMLAQTNDILAKARGVNTEGLTLEVLREVKIPRVEPAQRNYFVRKVNIYDKIENSKNIAVQEFEHLFSSLLTRAFSGELTAVWRDQYREQLAREAEQRDQLLADRGAAQPHIIGQLALEISDDEPTAIAPIGPRDEFLACLSQEQRQIWQAVLDHDDYLNAETLSQSYDLPLARTRQTLDLLASAGLLLSVALWNSEISDFVTAYRRLRQVRNGEGRGDEAYTDDIIFLRHQ